jgi:HTH-type transcriptional regulator/antitoxin HigA
MHPEPDTPEGDELEALSIAVERYEDEHYPMERAAPIAAIRFRMEQSGLTVADMCQYIGPLDRVHEVLDGKRPLSTSMIRRLHAGLDIPIDVLMGAST